MRHAAITLLLLAAAAARGASARRIAAEPCAAACASDLDCSLNGVCDVASGACACDAAWTGACCTRLALLPVEPDAAGYRHAATSPWGGNILADPAGGGYHMWIAEMAPNGTGGDPGAGSCGLTTWGSNSQVTHVTSATGPTGPYVRQEVAVPIWSHNPLVRLINGTFVMFHIGGGKGGEPGDGYCAANGTSPCGEQSFDQCGSTDACAEARADGEVLRWGADPSGGAPFAFLDPAATADIARTLVELSDAGMAIVFVTHDIAFAERVATRTLRLVDGRLAPTAPGSPRDDVRDPRPIPPA
jgi:hypothetical protein